MRQVIDKGRNPIALIDGLVQFLENHYDNGIFETTEKYETAIALLDDIRQANKKLDALEGAHFDTDTYYPTEGGAVGVK